MASAQISALSIHPYALLSSGAFQLHHFADGADLPGRFRKQSSAERAQPAAASRCTPSPTLLVPCPFFSLSVVPPKISCTQIFNGKA